TEAVLLVEYDADDQASLHDGLRSIVDRVQRRKRLAFDSRLAFDRQQRETFWRLARKVVPSLYRLKGSTRPLPFVEDVVVPPKALQAFLIDLQNLLKRDQVTASLFAHAGHGQLHIRPFLDITS